MSDSGRSDSPNRSPVHKYFTDVNADKTQIFAGPGNLQGYLCENEDVADVFVAFYDAAAIGDVTLGVTAPAFTQKVGANGSFGRDSNGDGYRYFGLGCVVASVTVRNGAVAPAVDTIIQAWSSKK